MGALLPNTTNVINRGAPLSDLVDFGAPVEDQALSLLLNTFDINVHEDELVPQLKEMFKNVMLASGAASGESNFESWWATATEESERLYGDPIPPWCAAWVADLMLQSDPEIEVPEGWGVVRAKAYKDVGTPVFTNNNMELGENVVQEQLSNARLGDIVVKGAWWYKKSTKEWKYQEHVGLFAGFSEDGKSVLVFGGNQGDKAKLSTYPIVKEYGNGKLGGIEAIRRVEAPLLNPAEAEAISILVLERGGEVSGGEESTR